MGIEDYTGTMPIGASGVYIILSRNKEECLYVGQSKCFNERLGFATHPVLMYLHGEIVPHVIVYKEVKDRRGRLFEESLMIGTLKPTLQFGNVPEPYKSYRNGKKAKNNRWDSASILESLRGCSKPIYQLWCKQIAMLIYHQSMTIDSALSYLGTTVKMSPSTFKRQLKMCGLNVYNLRQKVPSVV